MMMVRRRARPAKEPELMVVTSDGVAAANDEALTAVPFNGEPMNAVAATNNLLDDQYFASPKRKDCRLMKGNENLKAVNNPHMNNSNTNKDNSSISTKPDTGRTIETTMATTTTTTATTTTEEQKTITISAALAEDLEEESLMYDAHSMASPSTSTSTSSPAYQHNDDLEVGSDVGLNFAHTDTDIATQTDIHMHRSGLRDSHSSTHSSSSSSAATSDNIFLQEPVLTLDIDRTPTKASSIRINKSFELANAVFSSPPSVLSASMLNGRFNQIVTLNGHMQYHDHENDRELVQPLNGFELDQHDSSSCDSGVACSLTTGTGTGTGIETGTSPAVAGMRRRKPATPHRILCPSPIKTMPRDATLLKGGEAQSPRKSPRKLQSQLAATVACKSRRRLNQPKPQAPYQQPSATPNDDVVVVLDDDEDDEDDVHALLKAAEERENLNKAKVMLKPTTVPAAAVKPKAPSKTAKAKTLAGKSQPLAATNGNRELTEFFPVRRSVRKTKTAVKEEMMRNLEQAVLEERCEGLQVRHFVGKGRGVVAKRLFKRNEFVVEYVGDLIAISEAADRERRYALDENAGCYMYYFKHKNQQYCIDATVDTGKLGRLINHSRNGNLMTKVVVIKQRPHLVLLAKDDIEPGEELTYDYGDRSKESLLHHPWLAF
ncbi:histone-lysine N-methyltransferase PR-Set7 isoform X2 [Drosophila innubila]|uniref:histone-lysine N-methyltransferase PR-Set7 isoform X2 n=1 Tax=Drosophila innubila TaxID=198719 RepID=UPI00148BB10E|nr:histone-lysine N-methyltransferase PR-Set7 isoform X2 [Drosophila innubila]